MTTTPQGFAAITVVGAGAVGGFFGAMLARAGRHVTFVGRAAQVEAIARDGLRLERAGKVETLRNHISATTDLAAALRGADLALVCVKSTDTEATARAMAPHVARGAVVMSLQNGVENAATIARLLTTAQTVVPTVVYVATAMPEPGLVQHFGRGDLVVGPLHGPANARTAAQLAAITACFAAAQVPVRIADDVRAELWTKLLVNCAYNAISALAQASYGQLAALPEIVELQRGVVHEVVAVAAAEGIALDPDASLAAMDRIAVAMPGQLSSTAQDVARCKPSEIDHLNGVIVRLGRAHGIATPINATLLALIKLVEAGHAAG